MINNLHIIQDVNSHLFFTNAELKPQRWTKDEQQAMKFKSQQQAEEFLEDSHEIPEGFYRVLELVKKS